MKKNLIFLVLITVSLSLYSDLLEKTYYFEEPELYLENNFTRIKSEELEIITIPGAPELPSQQIRLLLPPGHALESIEFEPGRKVGLSLDKELYPIQQPYPLSFEGDVKFTEKNRDIYESANVYPSNLLNNFHTQYKQGHSILLADLTPFEYDPVTSTLYYYESLIIKISSAFSPESEKAYNTNFRSNDDLITLVQNPEQINSYPTDNMSRDDIIDFYIITNSTYEDVFDDFIIFKKGQGFTTDLKLTDNIYSEYSGDDNAEKIRNFIIDAYQNSGTTYILLGGDTEVIPHRGFYLAAGSTIDDDLPSDLYFSGLDRVGTGSGPDWNTDDDSYWGETNEADYFAEVMIGRISADTRPEFENALNKQMMYQDAPVTSELENALMVGENLNNSPLTWGGTYKDEISNGGYYNGYSTTGFSGNFTIQTQYDRTATWSWTDLRDKFNSGVNLVNHLGHSSVSYNMKFSTSNVTDANLTSNGVNHNFYIIYSQGCYPAAFDNRNSSGSYGADVIVEEFTTIENGCVAFLGNTRYGWYNPGGTNSGSQYLDRQFFDALFGENIYQVAAMHEDSRADGASQCNGDPWFRWAFYEVTLFGDPSLDVWTALPTNISTNYPSGLPIGTTQINFETDAPYSRIGLLQDGELIGRGVADASGDLILDLFEPLTGVTNIEVSIIAHDRNRHTGAIVVVANEPYVLFNDLTINDASGNGNGSADYGETIDLSLELNNAGSQQANSVNAIISTISPYVTITDNEEYYGVINATSLKNITNGFQFMINNNIPDQTELGFDLQVTGVDRYTWNSNFNITVVAPLLEAISWQIDDTDSGNSNFRLDPGETADIIISTTNSGHSISPAVIADLTCTSPLITINTSAISLGTLTASETNNVTFNITVDGGASIGTPVQFDYDLSAAAYSIDVSETFMIGLIIDDFENGNFSSFGWQFSGNANWFVSTTSPYSGSYCSESGDVDDDGISSLYLEVEVLADGDISFYKKVSSEDSYDYLRFYIDDELQEEWCGESGWTEASYPVDSGARTFRWSYEKDYSVSNGSDCAWIDEIVFPAIGIPGVPDISTDISEYNVSLMTDETSEHSLRINNEGNGTLNYFVTLDYGSRASGGPDSYGYTWTDSNEPDGPVYSWIDISGSSTEIIFTHNDQASSAIPIGFDFSFYGTDYTEMIISPNGWIGFGDDWVDYHNYGVPATNAPRPAVFGLWDDLDPLQGGNVYYHTDGDRMVVWFDDVIHYPGTYNGTYDFQMILYSSGSIKLQYRTLTGDLNTCTAGIQNVAGDDGLQIVYNATYLQDQLAVEILKPLNWLQVSPLSSSIPQSNWEDISINASAVDMAQGEHSCDILISSNDPDESQVIVPFNLTVTGMSLTPPQNIRIVTAAHTSRLYWDSVSGATGYKVYASNSPDSGFILLGTTPLTYMNLNTSDSHKFYRVTASN